MHDVSNIWRVPLMMEAQEAHKIILAKLGLPNADKIDLSLWRTTLAERWDSLTELVTIALIGGRRPLPCPLALSDRPQNHASFHTCREVHGPVGRLPLRHQVLAARLHGRPLQA